MSKRIINNRLSFVINPIDSFLDSTSLNDHINIEILNEKASASIFRNERGLFVFSNIKSKIVSLKIVSDIYESVDFEIDISKLSPLNPVKKIRLIPNKAYKFPANITYIRGKLPSKKDIKIMQINKNSNFRLFSNYNNGDITMKIYNPLDSDLEEKMFMIRDEVKLNIEEFKVIQFNDKTEEYILESKLKNEYKKENSEIFEIQQLILDSDNRFFMPVKFVNNKNDYIFIKNDDKYIVKKQLIPGEINDIEV